MDKPVVMPISFHQYIRARKLLDRVCQIFGITIAPVVNMDTVNEGENFDPETGLELPIGTGIPVYAQLVSDVTQEGGAAGIAPQQGRRETIDLSQTKGRPIQYLLRTKGINRDAHLAFLFMPISPWDKVNFKKIKGKYNLGMIYDIRLGPVLTLEQTYQMLDNINERLAKDPIVAGDQKISKINLDMLIMTILSCAADTDYNRVPRELQNEFLMEYAINFLDVAA